MGRSAIAAAMLGAALILLTAAPGRADEQVCRPSGHFPATTGIVFIHGKQDEGGDPTIDPGHKGDYWFYELTKVLKGAGFRMTFPEMPWSKTRQYDRTYDQSMDEIGAAANALKQEGAKRIVVLGHSLGANAAIGYAALRGGVAGVVAISPGQNPDLPAYERLVAPSIAKARSLIAAGRGKLIAALDDVSKWNGGPVLTTPDNFMSYFDPKGDAVMPKNVAKLPPGTPLLWIIGQKEELARLGPAYAFDKAPPNPLNRYVVTPHGHLESPTDARMTILAWLKCL